jgi:hypothetical protein
MNGHGVVVLAIHHLAPPVRDSECRLAASAVRP